MRKRNYCNNVSQGKEIEFFLDVTLTDYPENGVLVEYWPLIEYEYCEN